MAVAFMGSLYPVPPAPYSALPYIYFGLLLGGLAWSLFLNAGTLVFTDKIVADLDPLVE